ncbi:hypothetical protein CKO24_13050 [Rhodothalassium salexigens DSM 2132]|nr:hypothetical protein [Rhodothalassium salexigens DSM 2132]
MAVRRGARRCPNRGRNQGRNRGRGDEADMQRLLRKINDLNIQARVSAAFVLLIGLMVGNGALGLASLDRIDRINREIYEYPFEALASAYAMDAYVTTIQRRVRQVILAPDAATRAESLDRLPTYFEQLNDQFLPALARTFRGDPGLVDTVANGVAGYPPIYERAFAMHDAGRADEVRRYLETVEYDHVLPVFEALAEIQAQSQGQVDAMIAEARAEKARFTWIAGIFVAVAFALSVLIALVIGRGTARPLVALKDAMAAVAAGRTDVAIPSQTRGDEVGDMARAAQVFRDEAERKVQIEEERRSLEEQRRAEETRRLEQERAAAEERREAEEAAYAREAEERAMLMASLGDQFERDVKSVVEAVSQAVAEVRGAADSMTALVRQTSEHAEQADGAAGATSANVEAVSAATEQMAASIREIEEQVIRAAKVARRAVEEAASTTQTMDSLGTAADRIGEVVGLISDIAEQTNLLALNATIEAARAGEAGKGFAVVAGEVKSLASQTAKATDEITGQVHAMRTATGDATAAMRSIGQTIDELDDVATTVAGAVKEQGAATKDISQAVVKAAEGTATVTARIREMSTAAWQTGEHSQAMLAAAQTLDERSGTLGDRVDGFLAEIR